MLRQYVTQAIYANIAEFSACRINVPGVAAVSECPDTECLQTRRYTHRYLWPKKWEFLECSSLHKIVDILQVAKMHILQLSFYKDLTTKVLEHTRTKL
jgi:hypothetical protein